MITKFSTLPYSDLLWVPSDMEKMDSTNNLLDRMGLVYQVRSGFHMLSPILHQIKTNLERIAHEEGQKYGYVPISLPFLVPPEWLEKSGKMREWGHEFYGANKDGKEFLFSPTTEEAIISYLAAGGLKSYKQMPMKFYHPHHVFRHIKRPEGIFKSRDFEATLFSSFDRNEEAYKESLAEFIDICERAFYSYGINTYKLVSEDKRIAEFLFECDIGDRPIEKGVIANRTDNLATGTALIPENAKLANIAMGYSFNQVASLSLSYLDNDNSLKVPVMGTFGIGIQRCLYALFQQARLGHKHAFNSRVRPFDVVIAPMIENDEAVNKLATDLARDISQQGLKVVIDDRKGALSQKLKLADLFSIPVRVPIGREEMSTMKFELRSINGHKSSDISYSYVPYSALRSIQPKI